MGAVFRSTNVPAAIALLVALAGGLFADYQNREIGRERLRSEVLSKVSLIRARLEGNINGNLQLVRGLVATIATEPDMSQERFALLAQNIFGERSQIRNIAAAPGLVVKLMYPLVGNEKAIGLRYLDNERQREGVMRARDTGELVLAGPLDLVQGGKGVVGRFPVFVTTPDNERTFWGVISPVIDVEKLYRDSGLLDSDLTLDIAISGADGLRSEKGTPFFGDAAIFTNDPVTAEVKLPSGSWTIAAIPKGGWDVPSANRWLLRALILVGGAIIFVPILLTGRLIEERQRNIAELRQREIDLQRLSRRLSLALETSKVGVWEYHITNDVLVWDERMNELYGLPADSQVRSYRDWFNAIHPDDARRAQSDFRRAVDITGHYNSEYRLKLQDDTVRHIRAIGARYEDLDGTSKIVGVNWDVSADVLLNEDLRRVKNLTEARNAELLVAKARIEHTALHDSLTGLPNRRYLDQKLELRAAMREDEERRTALLHIDLDRFKQINDTLGHAAGDAMLVHAAKILKDNVRSTDFIARVGGDEFVVLCWMQNEDPDDDAIYLAGLAERIIREMREPVRYEGHECRFGVSVGIATAASGEGDPRRLLVNADIALYRAKSRGRNRYQFFNDALQAEIVHTKRVADEILSGLEQGQFIAFYQPQFDAETLEVTGVEALARWNHPTEGLLGPDSFLKVAEELNVVSTIDRMILEQALADFNSWAEAGIAVPKVSVNVSARRLNDEELIGGLSRLDIKPGTVSFELVESIFLDENDEHIGWNVEQIKELGIDIEIDDFGTGYASIVSLIKLKPRRLKIDRQLVMPITSSPAQRHLVESIIEIGKSLGIEVIAEGVETMEHARVLRQLGCHGLQGYAFARPMRADEVATFVAARRWRKAS